MEHIYQEPQFGPPYFRYPDLYREAVENSSDGSHFVEVGCFLGKSTAFMSVEIYNSGKKIKFDAIDHWDPTLLPGIDDGREFEDVTNAGFIISEPVRQHFEKTHKILKDWGFHYQQVPAIKENRFYETFLENMKDLIDLGLCNPIKMMSVDASKLYEDKSLDFVLIDGAHDYVSVCNDIQAWFPKVKSGGILAGDDWFYPGIQHAVRKYLEGKTHLTILPLQNAWKAEIL